MAFLQNICRCYNFSENVIKYPVLTQLRWRKRKDAERKRKPLWMPTAKSKFYRIPQHPQIYLEEKELKDELMDEYYIKFNSLRKLIQEEMKQKFEDEGYTLQRQQESEEKFQLLLRENEKENERIRLIREETLERMMQEKEMDLLQQAELEKERLALRKLEIEDIVRKEKERVASFINYENLDEAIEKALDNPVNYNFAINVSGSLKWEGKPPVHFEEEMKRRIMESISKEE